MSCEYTFKSPAATDQGNISWNYNLFARAYRSKAQHVECSLYFDTVSAAALWLPLPLVFFLENFSTDDFFFRTF